MYMYTCEYTNQEDVYKHFLIGTCPEEMEYSWDCVHFGKLIGDGRIFHLLEAVLDIAS